MLLKSANTADGPASCVTRMDQATSDDPATTLRNLADEAAKFRDEILGILEPRAPELKLEDLIPLDDEAEPVRNREFSWTPPEDKLGDMRRNLDNLRTPVVALLGRIGATLWQFAQDFPALKTYVQQFHQFPVVKERESSGDWRTVARQLDAISALLRGAAEFCRPRVRPTAAGRASKSTELLNAEDHKTIRRIRELAHDFGGNRLDHKRICEQLDAEKRPLPSLAHWGSHRSWSAAYADEKDWRGALSAWISKAIKPR
jgi:hypothetical protein